MLKSSLCDYSDTFKLMKGTIKITRTEADAPARNADERNKNFASFTDCISEINKTQVDNAKDLDVLMPMYNPIEYSNNYVKTSGSLCKLCHHQFNRCKDI